MPGREEIKTSEVHKSAEEIHHHTLRCMFDKGGKSFASIHEILGIISEEFRELEDAVHKNDHEQIRKELEDLGAMAIFSHASLVNNKLDW